MARYQLPYKDTRGNQWIIHGWDEYPDDIDREIDKIERGVYDGEILSLRSGSPEQ